MGGTGSKLTRPSRVSSGRELKVSTKEISDMANALFLFMYAQWEDKEIYDIARSPGDYVIAISDLITNKFHVLGYVTKRTQIGEIYFAKYKDLQPPAKDGDKGIVEQRENAQIIAFYFVRLFQMMSALLLVVKDFNWQDIDAPAGPSAIELNVAAGRLALQQGVQLPRFQPAMPLFGGQRGGGQAKINEAIVLGPYECLRYYLRVLTPEEQRAFTILNPASTGNITNIFNIAGTENLFFEHNPFKPNRAARQAIDATFPPQKFHLRVKQPGSSTALIVSTEVKINTMVPVSIAGIKAPSQELSPNAQLARYPVSVTLELYEKGSKSGKQFTLQRIDDGTKLKDTYANGADYQVISGFGVDQFSTILNPKDDITRILELVVLATAREYNRNPYLQLAQKTEKQEEIKAKVGDDKLLDKMKNPAMDEIYQLLKRKSGQPHCIARALQLIDIKSLEKYMPTGAKTSICKFSIGDKAQPASLSDYVPIKSVAALYGRVNPSNFKEASAVISAFVNPGTAADAILSVSQLEKAKQPDEAKSLAAALQSLQIAFKVSADTKIDSLSDFQISRPAECAGSETQPIKSQAAGLRLQSTAQQMLAFHVNMCIEISKFLKAVFNIQRSPDGTFRVLGPRTEILFAGFPALDQLVAQARGLLVDYYSGCEKMYQSGVEAWRKDQPGKA